MPVRSLWKNAQKDNHHEYGKIEMDLTCRLSDRFRFESVGGWAWRNIEHHRGDLRADRRDFIFDQPLIFNTL